MKNIVVLGGAGYLGSVMVQHLTNKIEQIKSIVVIDGDIFGDMAPVPSPVILHVADVLCGDKLPIQDKDTVIWALDIDCENFYTLPISRTYIKRNLEVFEKFASRFGNNLVLVTDDYFGDNPDYKNFLLDKMVICKKYEVRYVKVPQLFGPSARMRYDTILNDMFFSGFVAGVIQANDWLRKYPVCSVGVAGEYIVNNVVLGDVKNAVIRNCILSLCDYAGIMLKLFDNSKVQIQLTNEFAIYEYSELNQDIFTVPFGRFTIQKSYAYMINSLEKDGIADMIRDCHNNSKMLSNMNGYGNLLKVMGGFKG